MVNMYASQPSLPSAYQRGSFSTLHISCSLLKPFVPFATLIILLTLCLSLTLTAQISYAKEPIQGTTSPSSTAVPIEPTEPNASENTTEGLTENSTELISRGRYLSTAANCYGCHTQDPTRPFAGGNGIVTPLGTIYSTNITPDILTGIGSWSDNEFYRALHEGIGQSGENLYPAMPFDSYTLLTSEDVQAIKAYLFSLPAIERKNTPHELTFPYNKRWLLSGWKILNFHAGTFTPNPSKSDEINQGAYLANALAHCNTCHTPRTITMATDANHAYSGTVIADGWFAPNITSDEFSGIGLWTDEELIQFLSTGYASQKASAGGPMANAIKNSLSQLTEQDINYLVIWLRDQSPIRNKGERIAEEARSHFAWGQPQDFSATLRQTLSYQPDPQSIWEFQTDTENEPTGAQLYYGACATCHGIDGAGVPAANLPSMANNTTLGRPNPNNVVMAILYGVERQTPGQHVLMPAFRDQLTDKQIATLTNWLFENYGRPATTTTPKEVAHMRSGVPVGQAPITAIIKAVSVAIIALGIIFVLGWIIRLSPRIKDFFSQFKRKRKQAQKVRPARTNND